MLARATSFWLATLDLADFLEQQLAEFQWLAACIAEVPKSIKILAIKDPRTDPRIGSQPKFKYVFIKRYYFMGKSIILLYFVISS
jgi:hypothetical protein